MIEKILKFFSGMNGSEPLDTAKRRADSNIKAMMFQKVKYNTPTMRLQKWVVLGTVENGHSPEAIEALKQRLAAGEMPELKTTPSGSFVDRIALHQVIIHDQRFFLHLFKDSNMPSPDDYIDIIEVPKKFPMEHLPKEAFILDMK